MEITEAFLWGIFGGFVVDGLELYKVIRNNKGKWPDDCRSLSYLVAEIIRLTCGGGLAVAFWKSNQINGPLGAVMIGIATPIIVEKLSQMIPKVNYGDN